MRIEIAPKLEPLITKRKRVKILVGGRGSTKSTGAADYVLSKMSAGELWCCGREFQNTIDESVHRLLLTEIRRLGFMGFTHDKNHIYHDSGGRNFYRGLGRNPSSIQSMLSGVDGLWIEEGATLSWETMRVLTASLRMSAEDSAELLAELKKDPDFSLDMLEKIVKSGGVKFPEIIVTMNRGSSKDPIAQTWLKRAEIELARCGYYEDDNILAVQINYTDVPRSWFLASGLESERADDEEHLSKAAYNHKWGGDYSDTVQNAIIMPHWFDACIDAHEKLGFKPLGSEVVAHDPSDEGEDTKAIAYRHGSVILDVQEKDTGDVNEGCDWALEYVQKVKPDVFVWDADGMGMALKRQISEALVGKKVDIYGFRGAMEAENPDAIYQQIQQAREQKTNKQSFVNRRAQYYAILRDRIYRTYLAVEKGLKVADPDDLISFSSEIEDIGLLRSEICRIPQKLNGSGRFQVMSKKEMAQLEIDSPNMADSVMMCLINPLIRKPRKTAVRKTGGWMGS